MLASQHAVQDFGQLSNKFGLSWSVAKLILEWQPGRLGCMGQDRLP